MYFLNYLRYLICLFAIVNVFGADDDELIREQLRLDQKTGHCRFTMFGISSINRTKFSELFKNDSEMRYFSTQAEPVFKQTMDIQKEYPAGTVMIVRADPEYLTEEECKQLKLSYFYKKQEDKLFVLFSKYLGNRESESLVFGDLITDAFSIDNSINELAIYAPFNRNNHVEFMEIVCKKTNGSTYSTINIIDTRFEGRMGRHRNDKLMRAMQEQFLKKNISLDDQRQLEIPETTIKSSTK
ncbi:MAG: hypothetical protein WCJ92_05110, partial [Alphaproteobacteria bacterium]